jgi:hypothetical protein
MISKVEIPKKSLVYEYINNVDYSDAYSVKLSDEEMSAEEIYLNIFSHMPNWIINLMVLRDKIVALFGLKTDGETSHTKSLKIGEKAGIFMIYSIEKKEIIAGKDDMHLNFRVSVLKEDKKVIISTLVHYNNLFGKVYMTIVTPFHKLVVKAMIKNAVKGERI